MERQFEIREFGKMNHGYITETELRRRVEKVFKDHGDDISFSDFYWHDIVLPTLLHGEPKQKDEWLDFAESLDDGLHHWSAGDGIGYLVETFRKMPRGK